MKLHRIAFFVALLAVSVFAWADTAERYSFGAVTQRSPVMMARYWNPILDYVSRRSGVMLELRVAATGDQSSDSTVRGEYDFVYNNHQFKPSAAAQGYQVILKSTAPPISGQIVTLADSPIRSLAELQGKVVGFANSQAFVGYTVPMDHLLRSGLDVKAVFGGSQEGIMAQLRAGGVVAAGVNGAVMRDYAQREAMEYRVLWESQSFPDMAVSVHPRVPRSVVDRVQRAFAGMAKDPEGEQILMLVARLIGPSRPFGFASASQGDYQVYLDFFRDAVFKGAQ